jgi:tetratricopeptide (TPR) repeat protein
MHLNKILLSFLLLACAFTRADAFLWFGGETRRNTAAMEEARAAYARADYAAAVDIMEEFLLKNPSKQCLREAYDIIGRSYKIQGAYDKALLKYGEAVEFFPNDIPLNLALADIYYIGGLNGKAVQLYDKVLKLDGDNLPARLALARAYLAEGYFTKAAQYFRGYLDGGGSADADFYYDYASALFIANDYGGALDMAQKSAVLRTHAKISFLIAKIYKAAGEENRAFEFIAVACAQEGADDEILLTRALWLAVDKGWREGMAIADNYLKTSPRDKLALFIKYIALSRAGRAKESLKYLRIIAEQDNSGSSGGLIQNLARKILKTPPTAKTSNLKI